MSEVKVVLHNPEPAGTMREQNLIARVQRGQNELFYELVRPYERRVYAAALAILRNETDAEDVAQEAVLKAFANGLFMVSYILAVDPLPNIHSIFSKLRIC